MPNSSVRFIMSKNHWEYIHLPPNVWHAVYMNYEILSSLFIEYTDESPMSTYKKKKVITAF